MMGCFLTIAVTIIIVALIVVLVISARRKAASNDKNVFDTASLTSIKSRALDAERVIKIPIELLPSTTVIDDNKLFEITDNTVIARISQTFPSAANILAKTISNEALKNANYLSWISQVLLLLNPEKQKVLSVLFLMAKRELQRTPI